MRKVITSLPRSSRTDDEFAFVTEKYKALNA